MLPTDIIKDAFKSGVFLYKDCDYGRDRLHKYNLTKLCESNIGYSLLVDFISYVQNRGYNFCIHGVISSSSDDIIECFKRNCEGLSIEYSGKRKVI